MPYIIIEHPFDLFGRGDGLPTVATPDFCSYTHSANLRSAESTRLRRLGSSFTDPERTKMKLTSTIAIVMAVLASPTLAAPACTQRTTTGTWAFKCEGEVPLGVPTRSLGTCVTSKEAYWRCTGQVNAGGAILQQEVQGQATNRADCTGHIVYDQTINGTPAGQLQIDYVILENGSEIWGLPLNSGGVLACTLRRMDREPS